MTVNIPVSTVPAAQAYLLTNIQALVYGDARAADTLVCLGEPSKSAPGGIIEIASDVRRVPVPTTFRGNGGQFWLNESYDISVDISAAAETIDTDVDTLALSERAWQLLAYVETVVRSDPSLGDLVNEAWPSQTTGGRVEWSENNVGRVCELTLLVHCEVLN